MAKSKYIIEVNKDNVIGNSEILNQFVEDSLFKIVWLNKQIISVGEVYNDVRDIKRIYHGNTYIYYPIKFNRNGDIVTTNEDDKQGYILLSKRDYKTKYGYLKYETAKEIEEYINKDFKHFLKNVNLIIHGRCYVCKVFLRKDNTLLDKIKNIFVDNVNDLRKEIISRTKVVNDEMFEMVKTLELPAELKMVS